MLHLFEKKRPINTRQKKFQLRCYAFMVDLLVIACISKIFLFCYLSFLDQYLFLVPSKMQSPISSNLSVIRGPLMFIYYFSYFFFCCYLAEGRTLGKTIFKLRLVNYNRARKQTVGLGQSLLRSTGHTISYALLFLPFLLNYFKKNQRGISDLLSQTETVTCEEYQLLLAEEQESDSFSIQKVA